MRSLLRFYSPGSHQGGLSVVDLDRPWTQEAFASFLGVTQKTVWSLIDEGVLERGASARTWLLQYLARLREQAAGRATGGDRRLTDERARLAEEQANRVAMQNARARRELAPVALLELALADVSRQLVGILEAIPLHLRRRGLADGDALALVSDEIARARALAAAIELSDDFANGVTDSRVVGLLESPQMPPGNSAVAGEQEGRS